MLTEYLVLLTAAFVALAAVFLLGAVMAWRRALATRPVVERFAASIDERAIKLPQTIGAARAGLAERGAAAEHAWLTIARFDEQVERATNTLAERRAALDALRARLEAARVNVERLKAAVRLIMRAIELRRAFLG